MNCCIMPRLSLRFEGKAMNLKNDQKICSFIMFENVGVVDIIHWKNNIIIVDKGSVQI